MDDMFKQNLLRIRHPQPPTTFGEALFGQLTWTQKMMPKKVQTPRELAQFSEKAQVMESLERYAQEKLGDNPAATIKIPGGEIGVKPEPIWHGIPQYSQYNELKKDLTIEAKVLEICLETKAPEKVRIMFVPESFRSFEDFKAELKDNFINQLLPAFPLKTAELFSRMLTAMKLIDEEVIIYPTMVSDIDISSEVMKVAGFYSPEIIVTLGANATHKILKGQERLAQVHGQFFNRNIENIGSFTVVPLFHPSIIENNQNMKKTAWADMQKIMKHLKKL
jgi:uracil-DNA glycosylase family 4